MANEYCTHNVLFKCILNAIKLACPLRVAQHPFTLLSIWPKNIFNFPCGSGVRLALTNLFAKVRGLTRPQAGKYRRSDGRTGLGLGLGLGLKCKQVAI